MKIEEIIPLFSYIPLSIPAFKVFPHGRHPNVDAAYKAHGKKNRLKGSKTRSNLHMTKL